MNYRIAHYIIIKPKIYYNKLIRNESEPFMSKRENYTYNAPYILIYVYEYN